VAALWGYRRALALALLWLVIFVLYMSTLPWAGGAPAQPSSGAVGALFLRVAGVTVQRPFCTASVVASRKGNLLLTAAHCLGRIPVSDMVYAPYYRNGTAPFGTYAVTGQVFPPGWYPRGRIGRDFAFLTVAGDVQRRTGAEKIGYSSPVPGRVTVEAYSLNGGPVVCTRKPGTIEAGGQRQLRFGCGGFDDGSSGAPFLTGISRQSGLGTIVGVIGGYQQGGDTSAVSYSPAFGPVVQAVYRDANGGSGGSPHQPRRNPAARSHAPASGPAG